MLSAPDIAVLGALALLVFGPEQLPKVARKFGTVMRDVQSTSQQFIREMERAAEDHEPERPTHLEAVPSPYGQAVTQPVGIAAEETTSEPMLPGIASEAVVPAQPAAPKRLAEPAEF